MSACPTDEVLARLVEGALPDADALAISAHCDACATCTAVLSEPRPKPRPRAEPNPRFRTPPGRKPRAGAWARGDTGRGPRRALSRPRADRRWGDGRRPCSTGHEAWTQGRHQAAPRNARSCDPRPTGSIPARGPDPRVVEPSERAHRARHRRLEQRAVCRDGASSMAGRCRGGSRKLGQPGIASSKRFSTRAAASPQRTASASSTAMSSPTTSSSRRMGGLFSGILGSQHFSPHPHSVRRPAPRRPTPSGQQRTGTRPTVCASGPRHSWRRSKLPEQPPTRARTSSRSACRSTWRSTGSARFRGTASFLESRTAPERTDVSRLPRLRQRSPQANRRRARCRLDPNPGPAVFGDQRASDQAGSVQVGTIGSEP